MRDPARCFVYHDGRFKDSERMTKNNIKGGMFVYDLPNDKLAIGMICDMDFKR